MRARFPPRTGCGVRSAVRTRASVLPPAAHGMRVTGGHARAGTEASRHFSNPLDALERGGRVTIPRGNEPVAELGPAVAHSGAALVAVITKHDPLDEDFAEDVRSARSHRRRCDESVGRRLGVPESKKVLVRTFAGETLSCGEVPGTDAFPRYHSGRVRLRSRALRKRPTTMNSAPINT